MNIEQIREYCLKKKGVTEEFPFDDFDGLVERQEQQNDGKKEIEVFILRNPREKIYNWLKIFLMKKLVIQKAECEQDNGQPDQDVVGFA